MIDGTTNIVTLSTRSEKRKRDKLTGEIDFLSLSLSSVRCSMHQQQEEGLDHTVDEQKNKTMQRRRTVLSLSNSMYRISMTVKMRSTVVLTSSRKKERTNERMKQTTKKVLRLVLYDDDEKEIPNRIYSLVIIIVNVQIVLLL